MPPSDCRYVDSSIHLLCLARNSVHLAIAIAAADTLLLLYCCAYSAFSSIDFTLKLCSNVTSSPSCTLYLTLLLVIVICAMLSTLLRRESTSPTINTPCTHPSIHPSIHPNIQTSKHPNIQTYLQTYIHTYIHTYKHTYMQTFIHLPIDWRWLRFVCNLYTTSPQQTRLQCITTPQHVPMLNPTVHSFQALLTHPTAAPY